MIENNFDFKLFSAVCCFIIFFLITVIYKYKKQLSKKDIQLIQFYLDTKFLYKNLVKSISVSHTSEFCTELIDNIKEYYNLEDIIIIDTIKMISGENNTALRSDIIKYIQANFNKITSNIHEHDLTLFNYRMGNKTYEIYVSRIVCEDEGDGLIICVEHSPTLLTKQEKTSLETSINLLKTRLLHG